jgi:hypothetical protein
MSADPQSTSNPRRRGRPPGTKNKESAGNVGRPRKDGQLPHRSGQGALLLMLCFIEIVITAVEMPGPASGPHITPEIADAPMSAPDAPTHLRRFVTWQPQSGEPYTPSSTSSNTSHLATSTPEFITQAPIFVNASVETLALTNPVSSYQPAHISAAAPSSAHDLMRRPSVSSNVSVFKPTLMCLKTFYCSGWPIYPRWPLHLPIP